MPSTVGSSSALGLDPAVLNYRPRHLPGGGTGKHAPGHIAAAARLRDSVEWRDGVAVLPQSDDDDDDVDDSDPQPAAAVGLDALGRRVLQPATWECDEALVSPELSRHLCAGPFLRAVLARFHAGNPDVAAYGPFPFGIDVPVKVTCDPPTVDANGAIRGGKVTEWFDVVQHQQPPSQTGGPGPSLDVVEAFRLFQVACTVSEAGLTLGAGWFDGTAAASASGALARFGHLRSTAAADPLRLGPATRPPEQLFGRPSAPVCTDAWAAGLAIASAVRGQNTPLVNVSEDLVATDDDDDDDNDEAAASAKDPGNVSFFAASTVSRASVSFAASAVAAAARFRRPPLEPSAAAVALTTELVKVFGQLPFEITSLPRGRALLAKPIFAGATGRDVASCLGSHSAPLTAAVQRLLAVAPTSRASMPEAFEAIADALWDGHSPELPSSPAMQSLAAPLSSGGGGELLSGALGRAAMRMEAACAAADKVVQQQPTGAGDMAPPPPPTPAAGVARVMWCRAALRPADPSTSGSLLRMPLRSAPPGGSTSATPSGVASLSTSHQRLSTPDRPAASTPQQQQQQRQGQLQLAEGTTTPRRGSITGSEPPRPTIIWEADATTTLGAAAEAILIAGGEGSSRLPPWQLPQLEAALRWCGRAMGVVAPVAVNPVHLLDAIATWRRMPEYTSGAVLDRAAGASAESRFGSATAFVAAYALAAAADVATTTSTGCPSWHASVMGVYRAVVFGDGNNDRAKPSSALSLWAVKGAQLRIIRSGAWATRLTTPSISNLIRAALLPGRSPADAAATATDWAIAAVGIMRSALQAAQQEAAGGNGDGATGGVWLRSLTDPAVFFAATVRTIPSHTFTRRLQLHPESAAAMPECLARDGLDGDGFEALLALPPAATPSER